MNTKQVNSLPWVEKYRPKKFEDLMAHDEIIKTMMKLSENDQLPHLLFYGPPGTGKTSTIMTVAQHLYGPQYRAMTLELNASDERGINVVREKIKDFASTQKMFSSGVKLVILDEADAMTNAAQAALRRIVERFTKNTRFCFICNYINKISPAIQSRCTRFRFGPLPVVSFEECLRKVINSEEIEVTKEGINAITKLSQGDMRRGLNILQATSMAYSIVNEINVYECTGSPHPKDIQDILIWLLNEDFNVAYQKVETLKQEKGMALLDILRSINEFVLNFDENLPVPTKLDILDDISQIEYNTSIGCPENIQLGAIVSTFQMVREKMQHCNK